MVAVMRSLIAIGVIVLVVAAVVAGLILGKKGPEEKLVLTTFPGIDRDIAMLLEGCSGVNVEPLAPPGSDPHSYSLRPGDVQRIRRAVLIVSTGHAPFEARVEEYAGDKVVVIPEIPGIELVKLPSGALNLHMPIYDPRNYKVFLEYVAGRLETLFPECSQTIEKNKQSMLRLVDNLIVKYQGVLEGARAVASSPVSQYAVSWLGANISVFLLSEHGAQVTPEQAEKARDLLDLGAIAVVIVNSRGEPIGQANQFLLEEAEKRGAPVLHVVAPFAEEAMIEKIQQVAFEALQASSTP